MVAYFPPFYSDELFYSWVARFLTIMRFHYQGGVIRDLFEYYIYKAVIDLPSHLDCLLHNFLCDCPRLSANEIIDRHTLLPYYAPFLPKHRAKKIRMDMRGSSGLAARVRTGIMGSRVPLVNEMHLCPGCVESDRNKYGETYWHRSHQLPGVKVCFDHEIPLESIKNEFSKKGFITAEKALSESRQSELKVDNTILKYLQTLAKDSHWLLEHPEVNAGSQFMYQQYKVLLSEHGYEKNYGQFIDNEKLMNSFKEYFPAKVLSDLHCELDNRVGDNWLMRLIKQPRKVAQHPLHHLIFMRFLGQSPDEIFQEKELVGPFGKGPWPCLNPASRHYRSSVIDKCAIHKARKMSNRPIGKFICHKCGFIYVRYGPDAQGSKIFHRDRVLKFGKVWENGLIRLWKNKELSLTSISKVLSTKEEICVKQANRLGLEKRKRIY